MLIFLILLLACLFLWVVWWKLQRSDADESRSLILKWFITVGGGGALIYKLFPMFKAGGLEAVIGLLLFAAASVVLACLWVPDFLTWLASPFTDAIDGGAREIEARPQLSSVHAKKMQGRHDEAIADVQGQLERFPKDFEAQMLLAELLTEYKKDFDAGVAVMEAVIAQSHLPQQTAAALNTLADWQIKHRSDPDAARVALQRIIDTFPDDALATKSAQRMTHLPSREELISRAGPKVLILEHVEDYIQPGKQGAKIGIAQEMSAEDRAEALSERIRQFPQDTEAHEQLALIYAEEFGHLDWAADQIEQLIRLPNQPDREIIRWLEFLAGLQRKHQNLHAACRSYQRIIDTFPRHPAAERSRGQLAHIGVLPG